MPPTPGADHVDRDLVLRELGDLVLERLQRAGHVRLEHQRQLGDERAALLVEDRLQRELLAAAAGLLLELEARRALAGELARLAVVLDDAHELARLGDGVEAEHLDRLGRAGLLDAGALEVVHGADAAPVGAGHDGVADPAACRAGRARSRRRRGPGSSLDSMTWPDASASGLALSSSTSATSRIDSSSSSRFCLRLGRDVDEHRLAAPLLRLQAEVGHLGADAVGLRALLVDLVDRDQHRDLGGLRVVDRLAGLRHHAVVGRDHDHRDVGDLAAAGAHGGERLVARGVQEGDRLAVVAAPGRRRCAG